MNNKLISLLIVLVIIIGGLYWVFGVPSVAEVEISTSPEAIARGEYLFNAGGCRSCHQLEEAEGPTGGYEIEAESPAWGVMTFRAPNITPAQETGIGGWTGRDFILALKHGRSPSGGFYWPAFPYRSYQEMTDDDVLDIAAYVMSLPAIENDVEDHSIPFGQYSWTVAGWNIMANALEGDYPELPDDPKIQRGAYLARAFSHCGECHTPRNALNMMDHSNEYLGSELASAAIDPAAFSSWEEIDFIGLLELGMTASFDFVGGEMLDVVEHTKHLSQEDKEAMSAFFLRTPMTE